MVIYYPIITIIIYWLYERNVFELFFKCAKSISNVILWIYSFISIYSIRILGINFSSQISLIKMTTNSEKTRALEKILFYFFADGQPSLQWYNLHNQTGG